MYQFQKLGTLEFDLAKYTSANKDTTQTVTLPFERGTDKNGRIVCTLIIHWNSTAELDDDAVSVGSGLSNYSSFHEIDDEEEEAYDDNDFLNDDVTPSTSPVKKVEEHKEVSPVSKSISVPIAVSVPTSKPDGRK